MKTLTRKFYERNPIRVANDLLGKILLRRLNHEEITGRIVETEAYVENDIASKTIRRRKIFGELASQNCGTTFVYMVHGNWLLNIIAHPEDSMGGVLIRAIEPLNGMEMMKENRNIEDQRNLTNGPGTYQSNGNNKKTQQGRLDAKGIRTHDSRRPCSAVRN